MNQYTRQSIPNEEYCKLLGISLCVFNSNNAFIIENHLRNSNADDWYNLINLESGKLKNHLRHNTQLTDEIIDMFADIIQRRNRIIHSFQITLNNEQILHTLDKHTNNQFTITIDYLHEFIKLNEKLSDALHAFRGY